MNIVELDQRLQFLLNQNVITYKAYDITMRAFERLINQLNVANASQAEILFTHLPMALTRIEKEEEVGNPQSEIINEVKKSPHFLIAEQQVDFIEEQWEKSLPQGEKEYLYMHYANIINLNSRKE